VPSWSNTRQARSPTSAWRQTDSSWFGDLRVVGRPHRGDQLVAGPGFLVEDGQRHLAVRAHPHGEQRAGRKRLQPSRRAQPPRSAVLAHVVEDRVAEVAQPGSPEPGQVTGVQHAGLPLGRGQPMREHYAVEQGRDVHEAVRGQHRQRPVVVIEQVLVHLVEQRLGERIVHRELQPLRHRLVDLVGADRLPVPDELDDEPLQLLGGRQRQSCERVEVALGVEPAAALQRGDHRRAECEHQLAHHLGPVHPVVEQPPRRLPHLRRIILGDLPGDRLAQHSTGFCQGVVIVPTETLGTGQERGFLGIHAEMLRRGEPDARRLVRDHPLALRAHGSAA
jgi:hypothetical protein